jgi:hypothetical protein
VTSTAGGDSDRLGWHNSSGAGQAAMNSPDLRSRCYGAWWLGLLGTKQCGGVGGSYPVVLDDGHSSKRASDGGDLSPISRVSEQHIQGVFGP